MMLRESLERRLLMSAQAGADISDDLAKLFETTIQTAPPRDANNLQGGESLQFVWTTATVASTTSINQAYEAVVPDTKAFASSQSVAPEEFNLFRMTHNGEMIRLPDHEAAPRWFEELVSAFLSGKQDDAVFKLFDKIDRQFLNGSFRECESLLRRINLDKIPDEMLVALLSITLVAENKLGRARSNFFARVKKHFEQRNVPDKDRLLAGLAGRRKGDAATFFETTSV